MLVPELYATPNQYVARAMSQALTPWYHNSSNVVHPAGSAPSIRQAHAGMLSDPCPAHCSIRIPDRRRGYDQEGICAVSDWSNSHWKVQDSPENRQQDVDKEVCTAA